MLKKVLKLKSTQKVLKKGLKKALNKKSTQESPQKSAQITLFSQKSTFKSKSAQKSTQESGIAQKRTQKRELLKKVKWKKHGVFFKLFTKKEKTLFKQSTITSRDSSSGKKDFLKKCYNLISFFTQQCITSRKIS